MSHARDAQKAQAPVPAELLAYEPALRRYFRRRAAAQEVDDLVQDVFLRLHARRAEGPIEDLQRYLFTVAGHALIRRRSRDGPWPTAEVDEEAIGDDVSVERIVIGREQLARAVGVIAGLPERTRRVFVLHRFEEMTYRRIAAELGISVSAVEKHIMAALRALTAAGLP